MIAGYEGKTVGFAAGVAGLAVLPVHGMGFSDATVHQLQINANFGRGRFRPNILGYLWLDEDLQHRVPFVLGVSLGWRV